MIPKKQDLKTDVSRILKASSNHFEGLLEEQFIRP